MRLIWSNPFAYHRFDSPVRDAALELELERVFESITDTDLGDWARELSRVRARLATLVAAIPAGFAPPDGPENPTEPEKKVTKDEMRREG
jgi:hypothetical protein